MMIVKKSNNNNNNDDVFDGVDEPRAWTPVPQITVREENGEEEKKCTCAINIVIISAKCRAYMHNIK